MGLDMYAFTCSEKDAGDNAVDLKVYSKDEKVIQTEELYYWRKFNALHGWMESLYREKGGTALSFNCNSVRLTNDDLLRLERETDALKPVAGFFFGVQEIYPEDLESIADFISNARAAIAEGKAVYYDSWW